MFIASNKVEEINRLKNLLANEYEMKDMGQASMILGMDIQRDRSKGHLHVSQEAYIGKVLERFNMKCAKHVLTGAHFKLSSDRSPKIEEAEVEMNKVPYSSSTGSIMYEICTRLDIAHASSLISR